MTRNRKHLCQQQQQQQKLFHFSIIMFSALLVVFCGACVIVNLDVNQGDKMQIALGIAAHDYELFVDGYGGERVTRQLDVTTQETR